MVSGVHGLFFIVSSRGRPRFSCGGGVLNMIQFCKIFNPCLKHVKTDWIFLFNIMHNDETQLNL